MEIAMPPLVDDDRKQASRAFIEKVFVQQNQTAIVDTAGLKAAIDAVDDWVDANLTSFNNSLPEPFKSRASVAQKASVLSFVVSKRAGLL
jgi:hypothetical protein